MWRKSPRCLTLLIYPLPLGNDDVKGASQFEKDSVEMIEIVTHGDIRKLLGNFSAAIKLDQRLVDALPSKAFHPQYDDEMWRAWRVGHVSYIEHLLSSVNSIPPAIMIDLTKVATTFAPKVVGNVVLESFAEIVGGHCDGVNAASFFRLVTREVRRRNSGHRRLVDAREAMAKWLAVQDPLLIAKDPECQYRLAAAR